MTSGVALYEEGAGVLETPRPTPAAGHDPGWSAARDRLMAAVEPGQRAALASLLIRRDGGAGARLWVTSLAAGVTTLPGSVPSRLVAAYLGDPEAVPLHDCSGCGVAIPVRISWELDDEEPDRVYFHTCPACGERTGRYARLSRGASVPVTG